MSEESDWKPNLDKIVDECTSMMCQARRHLHSHPEASGDETATAQFIADQLRSAGLEPRSVADSRGVIADSTNSASGTTEPRIAIRADTDALHIQDVKQVAYASEVPGVMHACGHDAHTAIGLGVAVSLFRAERDGVIPRQLAWRSIFQPSEETNRGAIEMKKAGALENIHAIIALHVDPSRATGTIGFRDGAFTANCVELELVVIGRGGHAARPHESSDPIAAVAQLISTIYMFIPRRTDTHEPVVVSFGEIRGGENSNVIPDRVVVRGTLRTLGASVTEATLVQIRRLAQGIADASETKIELSTIDGPPSVHNDPALNKLLANEAQSLLGEANVNEILRPSMGGEDFANYLSDELPGAMFRLGVASDKIKPTALHSPDFDIDESALAIGAKILARSVVSWNLRQQ